MRSALLAGLLFACGGSAKHAAPEPAAAPAMGEPVVSLMTRDHLLRIYSGGEAARFVVEDHAGKRLASGIDARLLARDWPALFDLWQTATASGDHADVYAGR